ncbi:MAG: hypothetical protein GDA49_00515 [Rhodospirillales bacterium]|nr:hypothetical protein [Rhodospirillales bacterium]
MTMYRKGETLDDVLRRADAMLYQARDAGRNCIRWDEPVSGVREASEAG